MKPSIFQAGEVFLILDRFINYPRESYICDCQCVYVGRFRLPSYINSMEKGKGLERFNSTKLRNMRVSVSRKLIIRGKLTWN